MPGNSLRASNMDQKGPHSQAQHRKPCLYKDLGHKSNLGNKQFYKSHAKRSQAQQKPSQAIAKQKQSKVKQKQSKAKQKPRKMQIKAKPSKSKSKAKTKAN